MWKLPWMQCYGDSTGVGRLVKVLTVWVVGTCPFDPNWRIAGWPPPRFRKIFNTNCWMVGKEDGVEAYDSTRSLLADAGIHHTVPMPGDCRTVAVLGLLLQIVSAATAFFLFPFGDTSTKAGSELPPLSSSLAVNGFLVGCPFRDSSPRTDTISRLMTYFSPLLGSRIQP